MAWTPPSEVEIRLLGDDDSCGDLKLGDASLTPLKTFLQKRAKGFQRTDLARTFVVVEPGRSLVYAYVTILCTQVRVDQVPRPDGLNDFRYQDYPAIRLARLAVDHRLQGRGIGGRLMDFTLSLIVDEIVPRAGCRFLILDAKPGSVAFYKRKGFSEIGAIEDGGEHLTLMFVDLHRIGRTV